MSESNSLSIGKAVPDFEAPATSELNFKLSDYKGKSNLVIYFYPKDSTPGCTTEGQDFRDLHDEFKSQDTEIFGVSQIVWFIWLGICLLTQENANKSIQQTANAPAD